MRTKTVTSPCHLPNPVEVPDEILYGACGLEAVWYNPLAILERLRVLQRECPIATEQREQ